MSFYFRIAILVPVVLGAVLLVSASNNFKLQVLGIALGFLLLISLVVAIFAWFRPKHLVFGEGGHRAELKLEYGTEQHVLTHKQVVALEGVQAPKELGENVVEGK